MPVARAVLLSVAGVGSVVAIAAAATITLHVNTGAWEMTSNVVITGAPPIPASAMAAMANLPPEQRARVEAAMSRYRSDMGKPRTVVSKSCVTQKDLDRPFKWNENSEASKCTETVLSATSTDENIHVVCIGNRSGEGSFHVSTPTPGTMVGRVSFSMTQEGHTMNVVDDLSGRWLGADCSGIHSNK